MKTCLFRLIALVVVGVASISEAASQQMISGRVTAAETGAPLAGALVSVVGGAAILTGQDGRYTIQAPATATLVFSILGYSQRREAIQQRSTIDVAMERAPLDEIVAVGYGQQVRTLSGTVSRVEPPSPSTVTLRFQLIEANGFSERDPAIADVEAALRSLFRFTGYRLLRQTAMSNLIPRTPVGANRPDYNLMPTSTPRANPPDYQVTQRVSVGGAEYGILTGVGPISRSQAGTSVVDLDVMLYRVRPNGGDEVLLQTSVRVPDGQTVVLGSAPGSPGENTIILAVRPEVNH